MLTLEEALCSGVGNYASMDDHPEDARIELDRLEQEQYFFVLEEVEALNFYPDGSVARLAIIVKLKADGSAKRRIIVDMLRGGQNPRSKVPERPVLPRVVDVISDARDLLPGVGAASDPHAPAMEFASGDMKDAYQHFRVHPDEVKHCLTKDWRAAADASERR